MRENFCSFIIFCLIFTIISCGKSTEETVNSAVSKTNSNIGGMLEDNNDTIAADSGSSFGSCDNSKAFIVGNAVTEKGCHPNCPKSQAVIWNLCKGITEVGENSYAVDAAGHNGSIYIADDGGFYWIVGKSITKHKLNYSGFKLSEVTGIDVNSKGDVYVSGMVVLKGRGGQEYTTYWKNGEIKKTFRENADWYSELHLAADSNGNVFIPGWRMKTHEVTYSAIWINGNRKNLTTSQDGEATDVIIVGSDAWISGAHGPYTRGGTLAAYWRRRPNGQINQVKVSKVKTYKLPTNHVYSSRATSIFVSGSKVYMAGTVNVINAGDVPVYWKGKVQHELPVEFNLKSCDYCRSEPKDIAVLDGKVLVVGDYHDRNMFVDYTYTNGEDQAVYWLNKTLHKLCPSCGSSYAVSVVLLD